MSEKWVRITFVAGLILALLAIIVLSPIFLGVWQVAPTAAPSPPQMNLAGRVTQADFERAVQDELKDPVRASIWRSARSDHWAVVLAILSCQERLSDVTSMPAQAFSALLLDLTPSGSHVLPGGSSIAASPNAADLIQLRPTEQWVLSLSDSISRARLLSMSEVSQALPNAMRLWWVVLLVSGLATLFVTLQGKFRQPDGPIPPAVPKPVAAPAGQGSVAAGPEKETATQTTELWRATQINRREWRRKKYAYEIVAFAAVTLSILGTTLTALKQYYDPTRALVQNEQALRQLRKLHQEVVSAVTCDEKSGDKKTISIGEGAKDQMQKWSNRLTDLQSDIVPPYAAPSASQGPAPAR